MLDARSHPTRTRTAHTFRTSAFSWGAYIGLALVQLCADDHVTPLEEESEPEEAEPQPARARRCGGGGGRASKLKAANARAKARAARAAAKARVKADGNAASRSRPFEPLLDSGDSGAWIASTHEMLVRKTVLDKLGGGLRTEPITKLEAHQLMHQLAHCSLELRTSNLVDSPIRFDSSHVLSLTS